MERFFAHIGMAIALLLVGIVVAALIVQRSLFPTLSFLIVQDMIFLAILAIPGLLIALGVMLFRGRVIESGPSGNYIQNILGVKALPPLAIEAPNERTVKEVIQIPTVKALLQEGALGTDALLLGYTSSGQPQWGSWNDIRTFAIAGKGRSGKTITMFFFIVQAILNGCTVWVCDPHAGGKSSISNLLQPLGAHMRFAKTDQEIAELTDEFIDIMESRVSENMIDSQPMLLVTDEFTRMIENNVKTYQAVVACAQQYAKYNGFAMIAGHEWTGREIVKLRRALHAIFVHRLDEGYCKYLINNSKYSRRSENLKTGNCFFKDTNGDIFELKIPLGTIEDAVTVSGMLTVSGTFQDISNRFVVVPEIGNSAETRNVSQISEFSSSHERETKRFTKRDEVRALRAQGCNQSEIIQAVWKCKPGASEAYQTALGEYKQILVELKHVTCETT